MDIQKIIREGNIKVARAYLSKTYLNVSVTDDAELVHLTLTKLEEQGLPVSEEDYEAYQLLSVLMDAVPAGHPLQPAFLARMESVGECFKRPSADNHLKFPNLKVEIHDHNQY